MDRHSHEFRVCFDNQPERYKHTCTAPGTVLQSLKTCELFAEKIGDKNIVVERGNQDHKECMMSHLPCSLIQESDLLIIHSGRKYEIADAEEKIKKEADNGDFFTFTVDSVGGKNTKTKEILKYPKLKEFTVFRLYACEGETVEEALRRDGRFTDLVFEGSLYCTRTNTYTHMTQPADSLRDQHYQVRLPRGKKCRMKTSNSEQVTKASATSATPDSGPPYSAPPDSGPPDSAPPDSAPQPVLPLNLQTQTEVTIMPDSEILNILHSKFDALLKSKKLDSSKQGTRKLVNLMKEDFVKQSNSFSCVVQFERLLSLGESVCLIRRKNELGIVEETGTGFLLFDEFILTNAHVIEKSFDRSTMTLRSEISVYFDYKTEMPPEGQWIPVSPKVFAFRKNRDGYGCYLDFALLKLNTEQHPLNPELHPLLREHRLDQAVHAIAIIGHPEGGVKRMDMSVIIPLAEESSPQSRDDLKLLWTTRYGDGQYAVEGVGSNIATYNTSFIYGSSGSPVFNEECQLLAMHTGGFFTNEKEKKHIIEYAIPLRTIIRDMLIQISEQHALQPTEDLCRALSRFTEEATKKGHKNDTVLWYIEELVNSADTSDTRVLKVLEPIHQVLHEAGMNGALSEKGKAVYELVSRSLSHIRSLPQAR